MPYWIAPRNIKLIIENTEDLSALQAPLHAARTCKLMPLFVFATPRADTETRPHVRQCQAPQCALARRARLGCT
jgi:hypothetical protein